MFEKFTKIGHQLKQGAVEDVKRTFKEETIKCADDLFPTVVGITSITLLLLANVPPQKVAPSTITVNNFYFRR